MLQSLKKEFHGQQIWNRCRLRLQKCGTSWTEVEDIFGNQNIIYHKLSLCTLLKTQLLEELRHSQ